MINTMQKPSERIEEIAGRLTLESNERGEVDIHIAEKAILQFLDEQAANQTNEKCNCLKYFKEIGRIVYQVDRSSGPSRKYLYQCEKCKTIRFEFDFVIAEELAKQDLSSDNK